MALLAESLVEEWLNRQGYFTIRGLKHGVGEMDILAVRPEDSGSLAGLHVEVQVSVRPIGYIAKIPKEVAKKAGVDRTSAKKRTIEEVDLFAPLWVEHKFNSREKVALRNSLWCGVKWTYHLVHGVVKDVRELEIFARLGINLHPFHQVISEVTKKREKGGFSGSAGGDLAEIIGYYEANKGSANQSYL